MYNCQIGHPNFSSGVHHSLTNLTRPGLQLTGQSIMTPQVECVGDMDAHRRCMLRSVRTYKWFTN